MKKIYSFLFAAVTVFAAASCQKEVDNNAQATPAEETFTVTATVGLDTKTTLDDNGKSTLWTADDKISVFDMNPSGNNCCFEIATEDLPAATAEFKYTGVFMRPDVNENPDPFLVALYPYQSAALCDFVSTYQITGITVPAEQTAKADGFDSAATFALAIGKESTKNDLKFNNLYSLLKFTVADEGVKSVTVAVNDEAKLAGTAAVQLVVDPALGITGGVLTANESSSVTLECEEGFTVGETYYIAVAPVSYTSLTVSLDETVVKTVSTAKTLNANTIYNLGNLQIPVIETTTFFMRPTSSWENENGRYAAWCWGTDVVGSWYDLTDSDSDGIYELELPVGYEYVIMLCMKADTDNDWANELARTSDLTLPSNDMNCYNVYTSAWVTVADAKAYDPTTIFAEDGFVYLKPNSNWTQANAWFAICLCNGSKGVKWLKMNEIETTSYYGVKLPDDFSVDNYKNIIFVRMDSAKDALDWDSKWNQSGDLNSSEIVGGKNCCTINAGQWDCGTNVSWSTISQLN